MKNRNSLKIGIVLPSIPGYSETFFRSKIKGLKDNGHEVYLFVKTKDKNSTIDCEVIVHPNLNRNTIIRFFQSLLYFLKALINSFGVAIKLIQIEKGEGKSFLQAVQSVIIASSILPYKLDWLHFGFATTAIQRENIAKAINAHMAVSIRGFDISVVPLKSPNCYSRMWDSLDKLHTISDDLLEIAYSDGLKKETRVKKITPAINAENFTMSEESNLRQSTVSFLTVGRLHWKKGIEHVLHALSYINKLGLDFQYTIVGEGEDYERLMFATYQLDLSCRVRFIGKVSHAEVSDYMNSNDIYIQYSIQEGFCNAVLEAQASGMLCVVSDAEGLQENVLNGITGWVVPKRNPKMLASKLLEVLKLSEIEKKKIREQARDRVVRDFNLEATARIYEFLHRRFFMKTKAEIIEINKKQKAYYNNEDKFSKPNLFTNTWRNFRNGPLNSYQKEYNLRGRMYELHKEWMGDLSNKKVLDLGCLRGNSLSLYMAQNAKEYVGIDLSDKATKDLQHKIDQLKCPYARAIAVDFLSDEFKESDFDIIYAFGVLHHFENFDLLMKRLKEKLKYDGEVIAFDPLETSVPVKLLRKIYRPFQQDKDWEWPFNKMSFSIIQQYFQIKELRGVLGKSKYGLFLHLLPFSQRFKSERINKMIESDWKVQQPEEVLNCMQVTMRLKLILN